MRNQNYTYKFSYMALAALIYEVLFWLILYQIIAVFGLYAENNVGEQITFVAPNQAYWFILIPLYAFLFFRSIKMRNNKVEKIATPGLVYTYLKPVSTRNSFIRYFLIRNIIAFLVLAMMQPAFGNKTITGKTSGAEIVFAVDISASMNARDIKDGSSRLDAAKRAMHQFVNHASAAKVGILVFAGSVYPHLPLTADKRAAKMYIDQLSTDLISNQGTNIGLALDMARDFFTEDKLRKVVVLVTDGEDHEKGVSNAIDKLMEEQIHLLILGIGSKKGALVPKLSGGYLKDDLGQSVISKLNKKMIDELAKKSKGDYVVSNDAYPNITKLLTQINTSKTARDVTLDFEVKENRYRTPLSIALILFLILFLTESIGKLSHFKK